MKKIIAMCIDIVLEFDTLTEALMYLKTLHEKEFETRILSGKKVSGKYQVRIQKQYP